MNLEQQQTLPAELEIQIPTIKANSESRHVESLIEPKKTVKALQNSEEKYRLLFTNMINGYAYCKMLFDDKGKPIDFVYLEVNDAFEKLTGLKRVNVIGKRVN